MKYNFNLTTGLIASAKLTGKTQKLFDGGGLFLEVTPNGNKYWRYKYRFLKKQKLISLGVYPEVSLKDARKRHDEARKTLRGGTDPSEQRKAQKKRLENKYELEAEIKRLEIKVKKLEKYKHYYELSRQLNADR